jgi:hypothetical protein
MLGGAALTIHVEANREIKIKLPASIVFLCFEDGSRCQELEKKITMAK